MVQEMDLADVGIGLGIAPDWRQALTLKEAVEEKITKDGVIGIGIAATAVGLVAGGIAAALTRSFEVLLLSTLVKL
nr:mitochondrial fission 1 protein A-like [Ipomoea batatas]